MIFLNSGTNAHLRYCNVYRLKKANRLEQIILFIHMYIRDYEIVQLDIILYILDNNKWFHLISKIICHIKIVIHIESFHTIYWRDCDASYNKKE